MDRHTNLAPVILFVYNRPTHTHRTLLALSANDLAQESHLYIYCDGPKANADPEIRRKIDETRILVKSKNWCKEVTVIEKDKNDGLSNSIINGVSEILEKWGRVIVLEDDIVTGKGFLKYMNDGLEFYKEKEEVISIHGYNYPISSRGLKDTFFLKGADCWGWATWSRGWKIFDPDAKKLYQKIVDNNFSYDFDIQNAYPYTKMLEDQIIGKVNSWAIRWYASAFLANKFTLYPKKSLVKNIGLDGSGTHLEIKRPNKSCEDYCIVSEVPIEHNTKVAKRLKYFLNPPSSDSLIKRKMSAFKMPLKSFLKEVIPPIVFRFYKIFQDREKINEHKSDNIWEGNYSSWQEARENSRGYDEGTILDKCKNALLKVRNGEAVYERDSVLFDKIQYAWPLLTCLENIALNNNGSLSLIDFGGSLGSSYYQNRHFLKPLNFLRWIVVEQKHFVDCGKEEFKNDYLDFAYTIEEAMQRGKVNCLLLSGVLPYLPQPVEWIEKFCSYDFEYIVIDRTGFITADAHTLTIQNVPKEIYDASYPCWFFNERKFIELFSNKYEIISDFDDRVTPSVEVASGRCYWKGFFLKKKKDVVQTL
jgi:putative methyltransferase (TIGR04325 family)